ncbi:ABC transporter substrate-binding protein, partial [Klebsiella pneumoniae]
MKRRRLLQLLAASAAAVASLAPATLFAAPASQEIRIGFQKYGKLVLLKSRGALEPKLKALGYSVTWTEFPSGPPLLEAI